MVANLFNTINIVGMLVESNTIQINPQNRVRQIACLQDGTYLFLFKKGSTSLKGPTFLDWMAIHHLDQKGQLIQSYPFKQTIFDMFITGELQVVVLLVEQRQLAIIDLKNKEIKSLPYIFDQDYKAHSMFWFKESQLICIKEQRSLFIGGSHKQIKLTYLRLQQTQISKQLFVIIPPLEYSYRMNDIQKTKKAYNHSLVVFTSKQKHLILLHDLVGENQLQPRSRIIQLQEVKKTIQPLAFWEWQKNSLLVIPLKRDDSLVPIKVINLADNQVRLWQQKPKQLNYYWGTETYVTPIYLRDHIFLYENQFNYQTFIVSPYKFSVISLRTKKTLIQQDESTKFVEAISSHCQYDDSIMVSVVLQDKMGKLTIRKMKPLCLQDVYMQFLLCLNEDFDDDLLLDVEDLLDCL